MKVEFENGYAVGFKMAVAECFKDSLAKKRFNVGDIIYNDRRAYMSPWSDAIKHISHALQVIQMTGEDIEYVILRREDNKSGLVRVKTVKEPVVNFIDLLKTGP